MTKNSSVDEAPAHTAAESWLKTPLGMATLREAPYKRALHLAFRAGYIFGEKAARDALAAKELE